MDCIWWVLLVIVLCISTFGLWICIMVPLALMFFLLGGLLYLYITSAADAERYYSRVHRYGMYHEDTYVEKWNAQKNTLKKEERDFKKFDERMMAEDPDEEMEEYSGKALENDLENTLTGSSVIDEPLQEILGFIILDFIFPWYEQISDDFEFLKNVQQSTEQAIITLANSVKMMDWTTYLTTRLVDDVASHLRLYRQAKARLKDKESSNDSLDKKQTDLENNFFDLELAMEKNLLCRDVVSTNTTQQEHYLRDLSEVLLYILLPEEDFQCEPLRYLLRDILTNIAFIPLFDLISDPDFINLSIIKLVQIRKVPFTSEHFLSVIRLTDHVGELVATNELINKEIAQLRSRDLGREDDAEIKQQLSSVLYAKKNIDLRMARLQEGQENDSSGLPTHDWKQMVAAGQQLIALPLDVLLKNNVALSYFIDFMASIGAQSYLNFYLNAEGWRVSAEQQLSDLELQWQAMLSTSVPTTSRQDLHIESQALENLKTAAKNIYDQYFSEKASSRLLINETYVKKLKLKIQNETPNETWFDEIETAVYEVLKTEERFVPAFRQSQSYIKLLVELDLLKDASRSDDEDTQSLDLSDTVSQSSQDEALKSDVASDVQSLSDQQKTSSSMLPPFTFKAEITETGIMSDHGSKYGVYCIAVRKRSETTFQEEGWHIYRRYSDFLSMYQKIKEKYEDLGKLPFPSKKAFHNTERTTLEKRMKELNSWLQLLLAPGIEEQHPELGYMMHCLLQRGEYEQQSSGHIARAVEQLFVNPLKSSMRSVSNAVKSVPETMSRAIHSRSSRQSSPFEASKVGASLDAETDENIPLRIVLLLLDEVFDLKSRNQWLRRRMVTFLRQIIKSMFGDIVNRRILEYVAWLTSPEQVANYLIYFRETFWPNGTKALPQASRCDATKMRTRVAAKIALIASITDDIKHIMGSETTRRGVFLVFELFQHPVLNRRLALVLFEGMLISLFPEQNFPEIFQKLHSDSERTKKMCPKKVKS